MSRVEICKEQELLLEVDDFPITIAAYSLWHPSQLNLINSLYLKLRSCTDSKPKLDNRPIDSSEFILSSLVNISDHIDKASHRALKETLPFLKQQFGENVECALIAALNFSLCLDALADKSVDMHRDPWLRVRLVCIAVYIAFLGTRKNNKQKMNLHRSEKELIESNDKLANTSILTILINFAKQTKQSDFDKLIDRTSNPTKIIPYLFDRLCAIKAKESMSNSDTFIITTLKQLSKARSQYTESILSMYVSCSRFLSVKGETLLRYPILLFRFIIIPFLRGIIGHPFEFALDCIRRIMKYTPSSTLLQTTLKLIESMIKKSKKVTLQLDDHTTLLFKNILGKHQTQRVLKTLFLPILEVLCENELNWPFCKSMLSTLLRPDIADPGFVTLQSIRGIILKSKLNLPRSISEDSDYLVTYPHCTANPIHSNKPKTPLI